jgi:hypothetical protein
MQVLLKGTIQEDHFISLLPSEQMMNTEVHLWHVASLYYAPKGGS